MMKKANTYKLRLELLELLRPDDTIYEPIELEFGNHDNIFAIIEKMKKRNRFKTEQDSVEFAIGLKLFSEVMLKNKDNPLFEDFRPAFGELMKKIKSS
ncbi:DUF3861 domain-containing protein [Winogradskyella echinorum]|uniref:DUF3861 domain-containing protein n=1 Tax=Winogradskyella echinorum TaxID=538189 RepID=A0ABR6Y102_9FLAO|nr:DUF3861 domain-containing protein [Winogradskyella echinorum]MBC3846314.1 DUF3861 domain-containing protein [Winogradskyella echinorum]MBC5750662.1 DUF3861 domain-containing protein [Winogradskyella echinorum]